MHICAYTPRVEVEWDPAKATANLRKHRIDFADAATVLHDDEAITIHDEHPHETRWLTLGMDALGRILVVAYTLRHDRVRLISARRATRREQKQYADWIR